MADWDAPLVDAAPPPRRAAAAVPSPPSPDSGGATFATEPRFGSVLTADTPQPDRASADLPTEADALYGRVRAAEGTAKGSGYVIYGGKPFTPGKEHPGETARVPGPSGPTSAAGPGQWEEATWNGLKPEFRARFGHEAEFDSDADQKRMTWINAAKAYPGGEAALRRDVAAGKLNTAALAAQWEGFKRGSGGGWDAPLKTTSAGKWNVSPNAIAFEQNRRDTDVVWMSPDDYLGMVPASADRDKRRSLLKSLSLGDDVEAIPTLETKMQDGRPKIIDQDGRNRAMAAKQEGVDLIPVAVRGAGAQPSWIEDMHGNVHRFNFAPVAKVQAATGMARNILGAAGQPDVGQDGVMARIASAAQNAVKDTAAAFAAPVIGASALPIGALQLAAHGGEAAGLPLHTAVGNIDALADLRQSYLESRPADERVAAAAGDVAASLAVPASRIASLPRLARPVAAAAIGGATGAAQPVTGPSGDYAPQVGQNAMIGAAIGGGLQMAGEGINAGANLARRLVTRGTLTDAASRLAGLGGGSKISDDTLHHAYRAVGRQFDAYERSATLNLNDVRLMRALDDAKSDARNLIDGAAVIKAVNDIKTLFANHGGIIPGGVAAPLWHEGGAIDKLTKRANPDIRNLGQSIKTAIRDAFARQMPPADAAAYSALRSRYRDLKIVSKAVVAGEVVPSKLISQVEKRFPRDRPIPSAQQPPILRLARAAEETWTPGAGRYGSPSMGVAGALVGHAVMPGFGGLAFGGIAGTVSGHLLLDRLARARMASRNALSVLRPPASPNAALSLGQYAAPAATVGTMPGP